MPVVSVVDSETNRQVTFSSGDVGGVWREPYGARIVMKSGHEIRTNEDFDSVLRKIYGSAEGAKQL